MELCSIQDAFPDIKKEKGSTLPGSYPSKEERRAARKRAKKCKGPAEEYLNMVDDIPPTDPDRPALKRMGEIPAFVAYEDAFLDLSGGKFEAFKMPTLPAANCLVSDPGYPSYFGKGLEDGADEASPVKWPSDANAKDQMKNIIRDPSDLSALTAKTMGSDDEGFTNMFNDSAATVLNETFEYEFGGKGAAKAGAVKTLPAPSLDDAWKPLTAAKTTTAFFKAPPPTKETEPVEESVLHPDRKKGPVEKPAEPVKRTMPDLTAGSDPESMRNQMAQQMRELTKKFEDLEERRRRDTKNEVLLFVGTGLFILVSLDIVARIARR